MTLMIDGICDIGCVRANNEDMLLIDDLFLRNVSVERKSININSESKILIAVSDGMGGHNAGEVASELVLKEMNNGVKDLPIGLSKEEVEFKINELVSEIHTLLNEYGRENNEAKDLGCTFTGVLFYGFNIYKIHIGDSRLYRFRGSYLNQLSDDHTLRNLLKDNSIPSNKLINSFGGGVSRIHVDFEDLTMRLAVNDALLLCTDGLTDDFESEALEICLQTSFDVHNLVSRAKQFGGSDNISCIFVKIEN